jgi:hypothetical protein
MSRLCSRGRHMQPKSVPSCLGCGGVLTRYRMGGQAGCTVLREHNWRPGFSRCVRGHETGAALCICEISSYARYATSSRCLTAATVDQALVVNFTNLRVGKAHLHIRRGKRFNSLRACELGNTDLIGCTLNRRNRTILAKSAFSKRRSSCCCCCH